MPRHHGWEPSDFKDSADELKRLGRRHGRLVLTGFLALTAVILGISSYYQIEPEEVGIITRFGKYIGTAEPGPHLKLPFPIDEVQKRPVQRQLKEEFGFRTVAAGVRSDFARPRDAMAEATMLTGDLNVADVEWIVQYRIRDPFRYLFKVRDVTSTFRDISESTMRQVVGDHSVTEVLTIGREAIQLEAKDQLQELCDKYETGIEVVQLVLQDVNPPEPVRPSFNEVNEAIQERERAINEAGAEYNRVIPAARGRAEQTIQTAEGYATERVNRARGDGERYMALQTEYAKAPKVTRTRLYLETLGRAIPSSGARVVIDDKIRGLLPLLPLGKQPALGGAP